ncbi:MAG: hypothetical protein LBE05_06840 [Microbacterium sp.]|nr:hypothetical protein [Microbacterium sp.]
MRWDDFFEDLESQLDAEWESERAALNTETERLRVARLALRTRLMSLVADGVVITVRAAGVSGSGRAVGVGADWLAIVADDGGEGSSLSGGGSARRSVDLWDATANGDGLALYPLAAIRTVQTEHAAILRSALPATEDDLSGRVVFGFLMRDLARRRRPVTIRLVDGEILHGTIDRAGADHLDLAVHESGRPRRASEVRAHIVIPYAAIGQVRTVGTAV